MGSIAAPPYVSVEEFLSNPTYERCEWIDGRIVEIHVGNRPHAKIQLSCGALFWNYLRAHPGCGYASTEVRCRLKIDGRERYYLPDVAIVLNDHSTDDRFLEGAPDIVVEVRSPDDSISSITRKMNDYFSNGAKIGWIILPEERSVLVLTPDSPLRTAICGDVLDCGDLLPDLKIAVDELFL